MDHIDVVKYMTSGLATRREIFDVSRDRGMGRSTQIEDWIITEMLAKLVELRDQGFLQRVEGERAYQLVKDSAASRPRFERCDLWWESKGEGHWLEVKTVPTQNRQRPLDPVAKDLQKCEHLRQGEFAHHLTIVYPVALTMQRYWMEQLTGLYASCGWELESDWHYPLWETGSLSMFLASLK